MTIHRTGTLTVTTTDFQLTHLGRHIAIKCIDWGGGGIPVISILEKDNTGTWLSTYILFEFDDIGTTFKVTQAAGGTVNWIKTVLLPLINAALAKIFPKTVTTTPVVVAGSLEEIDMNFGRVMSWSPQTDGTLKVIIK